MSEMQCAGVRPYDLQSTMCAMSEMQCVPSSRKTYPCQKNRYFEILHTIQFSSCDF
jgi:hypothetical protein